MHGFSGGGGSLVFFVFQLAGVECSLDRKKAVDGEKNGINCRIV